VGNSANESRATMFFQADGVRPAAGASGDDYRTFSEDSYNLVAVHLRGDAAGIVGTAYRSPSDGLRPFSTVSIHCNGGNCRINLFVSSSELGAARALIEELRKQVEFLEGNEAGA